MSSLDELKLKRKELYAQLRDLRQFQYVEGVNVLNEILGTQDDIKDIENEIRKRDETPPRAG